MVGRSVRASAEEGRRAFPGDGLVPDALATWTHGATIEAPPRAVWPWLVQMGRGRAGWYSWDLVDNGGRPSAEELVPGWERVGVGDVLPVAPGADAFAVVRLEEGRDLVLAVRHDERSLRATWEFLLEPLPGDRTRLLVRARVGPRGWMASQGHTGHAGGWLLRLLARLPRGPILALARAGHRIMQARQLRGIRRRAEVHRPRAAGPEAPGTGPGSR